jgi:uncharacterized protein (UPF0305 family)
MIFTKHRKINNKAMCICGTAMIHKRGKGWFCPVKEEENEVKLLVNYPLIVTNEDRD